MLISIVMAVHNGEQFIKEAIDSILSQTYKNIELIIVDDASTDKSTYIINHIKDSRVKIISLPKNKGAAHALNIAIEHSIGDWIAIHDADDVSLPNRIETQINYVKNNPKLVAVGSWIKCIPGDTHVDNLELESYANGRNSIKKNSDITSILYSGCPLTHGSVMFSRKAFLSAGKYDTNLRIAYDYDLWTRLILIGQIENVPEVLYCYRRYKESLSSKNIYDTVHELFYSFAKYLKNTKFSKQDHLPRVVVFGSKTGCKLFVSATYNSLTTIPIQAKKIEGGILKRIRSEFLNGNIDGIIILDSVPNKKKLIYKLSKYGFVHMKNIFTFWSGKI